LTFDILTQKNDASILVQVVPRSQLLNLNPVSPPLYCWLSHNGLCLNPSKSDAILFGTHQRLRTLSPISSINIAGSVISLSETVTLGVTLDQILNLCSNINKLCKSSYYHIRALRHIRSSLPNDIHSRLYYCNSILYGTSASNLNKLQNGSKCSCQNCQSFHFISLCISPFPNLHWLPVRKRIDFKIATLTYKVFFHSTTSIPVQVNIISPA